MDAVAVTFVVKYAFIVTAIVLLVYFMDAVLFPCNKMIVFNFRTCLNNKNANSSHKCSILYILFLICRKSKMNILVTEDIAIVLAVSLIFYSGA